ncbi:MAG: histidinol dehydrogenase, partial [Acidobacteria bacterium]
MLKILALNSRRGRRARQRLLRRGDDLLDAGTLRRARRILKRVRRGGDRALLRFSARYDGLEAASVGELRRPCERLDDGRLPAGFAAALDRAVAAVRRYHEAQVRPPETRLEAAGVELVALRRPLRRVGVYVPGGRATYPSTAVMTVLPARLAGVREIVVASPPRAFDNAALRHALAVLGIDEAWAIGGAHAVAALAYGTETIRRVDKIVGPGNALVTAAKHLASSAVAIDGLAGPSEVVIVASDGADARLVAADLLAQAEHDPQALAVLITDRKALARRVRAELAVQLPALATAEVARAALAGQGLALIVGGMEEALELAEEIAPEHLQLVGDEAEALAPRLERAGAVFVGGASAEVFGDYMAGPSHVLPTGGTARFASGLGLEDFLRRGHRVRYSAAAAARQAAAVAALAEVEGL